jgi:16S rRNA (cytidine1402-2'-O)-methyltransferase
VRRKPASNLWGTGLRPVFVTLRAMTRDVPLPPGPALYLVATPIGNLEDITLRALRVLAQADLIACEDTRHTQKLLNHYSLATRTVSYHEHNEPERAAELLEQLQGGARVALVTDAGMPGISDPGFRLITLAIEHDIPVVPVPGASALSAALVASGLPTDAFRFAGFLPAKAGQRRTVLEGVRNEQQTVIFYEAPHRIEEALTDIVAVLGPARHIVVARELTKVHEEFLRGPAGEVLERVRARPLKGEITLLIAKSDKPPLGVARPSAGVGDEKSVSIRGRMRALMQSEKLDEKAALKRVAKELGISKSAAYRELQRTKT